MAKEKITESSDEFPLISVLDQNAQFEIPLFQRAYKWKSAQIKQFEEDLLAVVELEENHFLGAIIMHRSQHPVGKPAVYQVIDGQQRITTCFLSIAAITKVYLDHDCPDNAATLYRSYLVFSSDNVSPNSRLISCKDDRASLNAVFENLMTKDLKDKVGSSYHYVSMGSKKEKKGRVWANYKDLCDFFERQYTEQEEQKPGEGKVMLEKLCDGLMKNMTMVWIVVENPTDGPKIFNGLNSKQEPMTIGDLIRNELFSKISDKSDSYISTMDENNWRPFYSKFLEGGDQNGGKSHEVGDKIFEGYFFPYALTMKSAIKKDGVFSYLRSQWSKETDPAAIIDKLAVYQNTYLDLCYGTRTTCGVTSKILDLLNSFHKMNAPSAIYPFVFLVVKAVQDNELEGVEAEQMLEIVESFLVRRGVCGFEPTGLHAVFKTLWENCVEQDGSRTSNRMAQEIRSHSTVSWPSNEDFEKSIVERPLYAARITPYVLEEWDRSLGGDVVILSSKQIEHVLPQNPDSSSEWMRTWPQDEQDKKKDCLANLLPVSESLNKSVLNADYAVKKEKYDEDSALKSARSFARAYDVWTPNEFDIRAKKLCSWAITRWAY